MKIQQVKSNISMGALYFPKKPLLGADFTPEIKQAIQNNPYIKSLSQKEDVFARFVPKGQDGMMQHLLILDILDFSKRQTKKSMWFSSRLFGGEKDISAVNFINSIKQPTENKPAKSFWKKLFTSHKNTNQTKYYNYEEVTPNTDNATLLKKGLNAENDALKEAESKRVQINADVMKEFQSNT